MSGKARRSKPLDYLQIYKANYSTVYLSPLHCPGSRYGSDWIIVLFPFLSLRANESLPLGYAVYLHSTPRFR
jgi:hypothetical protein